MRVKIELNSKELSALVGDSKDDIEWDWEINVYTESGSVSKRGELAVFAGMYWALMTMLPHRIVNNFTLKWNSIIEEFQSKMIKAKEAFEEAKKEEPLIIPDVPDKVEPPEE